MSLEWCIIFGIGSEEEFLLFGTVEPAVVADGQRPVAVQLVGHVDGLHDAVTVVLRIKREVTDTLVAHGIVAHLIDDHLQQMQLRWRAWFTWRIVTIDEHQSVLCDGQRALSPPARRRSSSCRSSPRRAAGCS